MDKKELREKYKNIRNNIINRKYKSKIIIQKVIESDDYKKSNIIAIYNSFGSEVDTSSLIFYSIKNGKVVVLPKVINNEMKFYKIKSLDDNLVKSKFGIKEPVGNKEDYVNDKSIDLIIVPGLCFDKNNNRLGYGGGYYDRLLRHCDAKNIAIAFKEQILENDFIPINDYDIKVKKIITD